MSTLDVASRPVKLQSERATTALSLGLVTTYLTLIVGLPIAALVFESTNGGWQGFWDVVTSPEAIAALKLTLWTSIAVTDQRGPRDDHRVGPRPQLQAAAGRPRSTSRRRGFPPS